MTKVELSSVVCIQCRMPAQVNEEHLCEFCTGRAHWERSASDFPWVGFAVISIAGAVLGVLLAAISYK